MDLKIDISFPFPDVYFVVRQGEACVEAQSLFRRIDSPGSPAKVTQRSRHSGM